MPVCRGQIILHEPDLRQLMLWAARLEEDDQLTAVYALCKDVDACFQSFAAQHQNIDAAGGLVKKENAYLFIKRFGRWDLPKGKVEKGETLAEAAVREVEEECAVTELVCGQFIATTYHTYAFQGGRALKHSHWFEMFTQSNKPLTPQTEEGITVVRWMHKDELAEVYGNTYASIAALLKYYFND